MHRLLVAMSALMVLTIVGCTSEGDNGTPATGSAMPSLSGGSGTAQRSSSPKASPGVFEGIVKVDGDRGLWVRCSGRGTPTVLMEGGDEDTSSSYAFAESRIASLTRTCVYDRANLGSSDPAEGPRQLSDLVADVERLLGAAHIPAPYVLVGTSGGGYISAGYAVKHRRQVAGMVFVEVPTPFRDPPAPIVDETRWDSPVNIENRDYLQVEKDAWGARRRIGDIPMTVISNEYSAGEIAAAQFPSEARGMRSNVEDQRGWLLLSPRSKQLVVHTGHAVEEARPDLVVDTIAATVRAARES